MSKKFDHVTERLLNLALGGSCVVNRPRISYATLRKYAPERAWRADEVEGGIIVTRIR